MTFSYSNFGVGANQTTENASVNGTSFVTNKAFNFNVTQAGVFDTSDQIAVPAGTNGESLSATATWSSSQTADGVSGSATPLSGQTITCAQPAAGPPSVTLTTPPAPPATYYQGENVPVDFSCTAGTGGTLQSCTSTAGPEGTPINTSTLGNHCVTATATDTDGQTNSPPVTHCYNVVPLTYTGRAYDAAVAVGLLGIPLTIGPINDTGNVSTTSTSFSAGGPLVPLGGLLSGGVLNSSVTTAPGTSTAGASVDAVAANLGLIAAALPVIDESSIVVGSSASCTKGVLSTSASTTIAYLKIGSTLVVGPAGSGAKLLAGSIPKNTTVAVPGLLSVTLNEQQPIADGIAVNAVDIKVGGLFGLTNDEVVISHAESDLEGCSAVTG